MKSSSPESLLKQALRGSSESLGELLQVYVNYLKLLSTTQLNRRVVVRVSPSDLVQETFMDAHRDFGQFRGRSVGEFMGWLRQILVNNIARVVRDHMHTEKRDVRREKSLQEIAQAIDQSNMRFLDLIPADVSSPSSAIQKQELLIVLADELAALPEESRRVLMMRHIEGLPFKTIATALNRTDGSVRMLWLRGIEKLRIAFQQRGIL